MNKLQKSVADFIRRNAALTKKASDEILEAISFDTSIVDAQKIIDRVYKKYGIIAKRKELLMNSITDTASIAIGQSITGEKAISFQRWYMDKAYKFEGETFSERAKSLGRLPELKKEITTALKQGRSWRETAQKISDKKLTFTDVAGDIGRVADEARAMYGLSENAAGYADYLKSVKRVKARINRLTDQDTSKLRAAYQDILDLTNKSSIAEIDNAVKYASYFKERYNAERIARTEMAKAYGDSTITEAVNDEDVIGIKFVLSSGHPEPDLCNFHTGANLFGMGAGVYPVGDKSAVVPDFPFHCNCLCNSEYVYEGETAEKTASDYSKKAGEKYLKSLPESERKAILGVGGNEAFEKNPKSWTRNKNMQNTPTEKKPTIPVEVLYGR